MQKNVFEFLVRKSYNAQRKSITGTKNKHSKAYHLCVFFDENFKTCLLKNLFKKIGELRANKIFFLIENYNKIDLYFLFKKNMVL